jgi:hypothetical protein
MKYLNQDSQYSNRILKPIPRECKSGRYICQKLEVTVSHVTTKVFTVSLWNHTYVFMKQMLF